MYLCFTRMLLVCTRVLLVCTRMFLVCTRMLLVCTRVVLYVLVCTCVLLVCYSYVLVWCFSHDHHMTAIIFLAQNNPIFILTCRLNVRKEAKSFVRLLRIFYPAKPFILNCQVSSTILVFWKVCICTLTSTLCNDMISCCSIGG